ncbi:phosphotransferase family protein [Streptomyces mirabilis]|uniref:hypothetical protein n=1 Tax=Streptomyces mirabilis TaxID=68239 RepID=UPI0036498364
MTSPSRDRVADVRSVVVTHMLDYQIDSVVPLGEGLDNLAYEVNGELIVRFSKEPDLARRASLVGREARVLPSPTSRRCPSPNRRSRFTERFTLTASGPRVPTVGASATDDSPGRSGTVVPSHQKSLVRALSAHRPPATGSAPLTQWFGPLTW